MKTSLLTLAAVLALTGSGCENSVDNQRRLARDTLNKLLLVENCRDLESLMSPKLYEVLGPCNPRARFHASDWSELKAEVESCVPDEHFTKDGKEFAVDDDGGYSVAFRCLEPKEEGGRTDYILLRRVGSTHQIVNMIMTKPSE